MFCRHIYGICFEILVRLLIVLEPFKNLLHLLILDNMKKMFFPQLHGTFNWSTLNIEYKCHISVYKDFGTGSAWPSYTCIGMYKHGISKLRILLSQYILYISYYWPSMNACIGKTVNRDDRLILQDFQYNSMFPNT